MKFYLSNFFVLLSIFLFSQELEWKKLDDPKLEMSTLHKYSTNEVLENDSLEISVFKLQLEKPLKLYDLENGQPIGFMQLKDFRTIFKHQNLNFGFVKNSEYLIKWEEPRKELEFSISLNEVSDEELIAFQNLLIKDFSTGKITYISPEESTQRFKEQSGQNSIFLSDQLFPPIYVIELNNSQENLDLIHNWIDLNKSHKLINNFELPEIEPATWVLKIKS